MSPSHDPPSGGSGPIRPRFVRLLTLVHPLPKSKPKPKRPRHEGCVFTQEEQARLRLALRNARLAFGSRARLAEAMGCGTNALFHAEHGDGGYQFSAALAIRLARVTGMSLDAILAPGLRVVNPRPGPEGVA